MRKPHPQSQVTLRYRGHLTNKKRYISTFARPVDTKYSRVVTQYEGTPKSRDATTTWSRNKSKMYISTFTRPIHTRLRKVVSQGKGTPPTESRETSITRSRENQRRYISTFTRSTDTKLSRVVTQDESQSHVVTWQIKNILSSLSQGARPKNLAGW